MLYALTFSTNFSGHGEAENKILNQCLVTSLILKQLNRVDRSSMLVYRESLIDSLVGLVNQLRKLFVEKRYPVIN